MNQNVNKLFSLKLSILDKLQLSVLFICLAIIPLYFEYTWISTNLILPGLAVSLFIKDRTYKLHLDSFIKKMILICFFAIISIITIYSLKDYLLEIKKLFGVIIIFLIGNYLLRRNINNIWPLYLILLLKFILMLLFTYKNGLMTDFDAEANRLKSGEEVGINANAYGYFAFIALYSIGFIVTFYKKKILLLVFLITLVLSIYINILAASRAGLIFSIFSALLIYLSLTYKSLPRQMTKLFVSIIILLIGLSIINESFNNIMVVKRFNSFKETGEDERIIIFQNGLDLLLNHPFGVGAGHFPLYMSNYSNLGKIAASHNGFLLIAANYGILALVIYFSIFYSFFKSSFLLFKIQDIKLKRSALLFLSFGILFFFYHLFYDMVLNLYIMFMFFLVNYHLKNANNRLSPYNQPL